MINEESSNISAGQRQLITIARAFLTRPARLILDEETSSVDPEIQSMEIEGHSPRQAAAGGRGT